MMNSTVQVLTALTILILFVVLVISTQFARRRRIAFPLRPISAYAALPLMVGEAIEAGRPVHLSFGSAGLGGYSTPLALASADFFDGVTQRAATGSIMPIVTMSETSAIPLGYGTLRRAYAARGRLDRAQFSGNVRWYAGGTRSLAFAAALTGVIGDDRPTGNILAGSFGTELALPLDAAMRRRQLTIAGSDQLDGAAIAYVMADHALLGEEVFTAGAYLDDRATALGTVVTMDVLRLLLILSLLIPAIVVIGDVLLNGAISRFFATLFGGG